MASDKNSEQVQGTVERVTFHSEDTGFCVLRVKTKTQREAVTVIGSSASIAAGEYIECQGEWVNDKKHGPQFKAQQLKAIAPTTLEGIEKYLGSGMVRGIGPHLAKKLIKAFGDQVFEVIEKTPKRLTELEGIGRKRQKNIVKAWAQQKSIRDIMVFLQSYGVGTARAVRIYKTYGKQAIDKVKENPYRLALDIRGIGFKTADTLAMELGISNDSPIRAQAGVRHALQELCDRGHCAVEVKQLMRASQQLLAIPVSIIEQAIVHEIQAENIVQDCIDGQDCIYPISLYRAEKNASEHMLRLSAQTPPWGAVNTKKEIPWVEGQTGLELAASQCEAIETVLKSKLSIITGGPGVGKTTLVNSLLKIIKAKDLRISLCAPTGRAAKRLTETTGISAKTIHRLLDFDPSIYGFRHDQDNPLLIDILVVDEASMIDIALFNNLLKAVPDHAAIIFVGDIDQLPSVGSGAVLSDLIKSEVITTVRLTEIFRQAKNSKIIVNAHRINQGGMPLENSMENNDFFIMYANTPEDVHQKLIDVVSVRLPKHYQCDSARDIQVLTPMNKGGLGSRGLNIDLQAQLNKAEGPKITRFGSTFSVGDKVIQMTNNYDKEVFNGDIGFIEYIDTEEGVLEIRFDQAIKEYETNELDDISLAYAISIHKSQGSEFPFIVIPLVTQHYALLARNLLYTGITRGKKLVVIIGQKRAVEMAIQNNKESNRLTNLAGRLKQVMA